jgi:hypothetical protein
MRYTIADLTEAAGLSPRTIRRYVAAGIIPPPDGNTSDALYTSRHLEIVLVITRMRQQGIPFAVAAGQATRWKDARLRRFLAESDPESPPTAPPLPVAEPAALPPRKGTALEAELPAHGAALVKGARSFKFIPILPDLMLCVGDGASPLVQRVAAEICDKYGSRS